MAAAKASSKKGANIGVGRSAARLGAVQALYQMEMSGASADKVLMEFLLDRMEEGDDAAPLAAPDKALLGDLIKGVTAERRDLDAMLTAVLDEDWILERLEILLLVLLRAGAYEISARPKTPARVAINEYVDLAHAFFSEKEPGMVNAMLDRLARSLRPEEFEGNGGR